MCRNWKITPWRGLFRLVLWFRRFKTYLTFKIKSLFKFSTPKKMYNKNPKNIYIYWLWYWVRFKTLKFIKWINFYSISSSIKNIDQSTLIQTLRCIRHTRLLVIPSSLRWVGGLAFLFVRTGAPRVITNSSAKAATAVP